MQVMYKQNNSAEGIGPILHLKVTFIEVSFNRREWETCLQHSQTPLLFLLPIDTSALNQCPGSLNFCYYFCYWKIVLLLTILMKMYFSAIFWCSLRLILIGNSFFINLSHNWIHVCRTCLGIKLF